MTPTAQESELLDRAIKILDRSVFCRDDGCSAVVGLHFAGCPFVEKERLKRTVAALRRGELETP